MYFMNISRIYPQAHEKMNRGIKFRIKVQHSTKFAFQYDFNKLLEHYVMDYNNRNKQFSKNIFNILKYKSQAFSSKT